jgi:membrane-associated phospholipid phosphatase
MKKKFSLILLLFLSVPLTSQNLDIRILRSLNSPRTLPSDNYFRFLSNSDSYLAVGLPLSLGVAGVLKHDDRFFRNACVGLATIAVNEGITMAIKYSVNRTRPYLKYPDITKKSGGGSPSFPSGHTSIAFATATSLSLAYPKWYVIIPSFAWAGSVGYSRMHLGVHYPSDVLAGAIVGAGSAWLTYHINKKLIQKSTPRY